MKKEITEFMIKEHGKILVLLLNVKNKSKTSEFESAFNQLDTNLGRHVLAEEKAIMMLESKGRKFKEMQLILQQHEKINELMKNIKRDFENEKRFNEGYKGLLELMKVHINLENKKFYPKLDKELDSEEKKVVYAKLHSAIIGNIMN